MTMLEPEPTTLEHSLRAHAIPAEELLRRHPDVVPLVGRILGVIPRSFSYQEIWPPAFVSYGLTVPVFFDIPFCDAGLGIGPDTRSLVAYAASRSHGCMYCSAHCAALGSVFKGSELALQQNASAIQDGVCQLPSPRQRALVEFGMAVARVPAEPIAGVMERLQQHLSPAEIEKVVLVTANMGMLNRCMDTFGMVLEGRLLEMARSELSASGWQEASVFDEARDAALLEAERVGPKLPELGPWQLGRKLLGAIRFETRALAGMASRRRKLDEQLGRTLGFVPAYLTRFHSNRVRRTLAHLLCERIMSTDEGALGPGLRCAMALVAARASGNSTLAAHFAYLGERADGGPAFRALLQGPGRDSATLAALDFARLGAGVPPSIDSQLVQRLAAEFPPAVRVELVLVLSIYSCLQRISVAYPAEQPEPVIAEFLARHGAAYGL